MDPQSTIETATPVEKIVLLGAVCRGADSTNAVRLDEIRSACNERLDELTGRLSEADVTRALNNLEDSGVLVGRQPDRTSPVGKGRPSYALEVGPEVVLDAVSEDERFEQLAESVAREIR